MSSSEQLRRRLEELNRRPLAKPPSEEKRRALEELRQRIAKMGRQPAPPSAPSAKPAGKGLVFRRDVPLRPPAAAPRRHAHGAVVRLESAVEGREVRAPDGSTVYLVEQHVDCTIRDNQEPDLACALGAALERQDSSLRPHLEHAQVNGPLQPQDLIFFDLETTGLSACPLFLIGIMVWDDGCLLTRQYFARDYSEERAALLHFLDQAAGKKLLVSYNGKSFDMPFLRTRSAAHRIPAPPELPHLDLLHSARRTWRWRLPDCRLQTVERWICSRVREGDIPSDQIPDAYHAYVHTGNAAEMIGVLEHNRLDLVTLGEICVRLPSPGVRP